MQRSTWMVTTWEMVLIVWGHELNLAQGILMQSCNNNLAFDLISDKQVKIIGYLINVFVMKKLLSLV